MKAIYLRVSTDELSYDDQLPIIIKTYSLHEGDCCIYEEKVSAYKKKSQEKRTEFIRLKQDISKGKVSDVYVYSLERIERSIERMFEFYFFCKAHNCKVHGALQPSLDMVFEDSPMGKFSQYMQVIVFGLLAENESYLTSLRTKKAYKEGFSSYGKKWGGKLRGLDGNSIDVNEETVKEIQNCIVEMLRLRRTAQYIVDEVKEKHKILISKMYVTRVKKDKLQNGNV
jgi:DNA invertase Pin-like site-specific DNA recombinase